MKTEKYDSILILIHTGLDIKITEKDCEGALPLDAPENRKFVEVKVGESKLSELYGLDFDQLALEQNRIYQKEVEPWIKENPNGVIAYFGLVPVPLAIHLGYLLGNFNKYWIYQYHHKEKEWYKNISDKGLLPIDPLELPSITERGRGDVLVRISTSYLIDKIQSLTAVSEPMKEIDLKLEQLDIDAFENQEQLDDIGNRFQDILSSISSFLPFSTALHLMSATPCGLSFLLGSKVNPNTTPKIVTYQFSKDEHPPYKEALVITKLSGEEIALTDEEINEASELRKEWAETLGKNIKGFINGSIRESDKWYEIFDPDEHLHELFEKSQFRDLPSLRDLSLKNDSISVSTNVVDDGFDYDRKNSEWFLDDRLLLTIRNRSEKTRFDLSRAGRLFLFHEGLHYSDKAHNLVKEKADGIGRFPKAIEEADYQADVYAILSDFKYSSIFHSDKVEDIKSYILDSIDAAVETMWSFIDAGEDVVQFQIRTLNRLLIWYWQYVMIESKADSLFQVIEILTNRPTIEIAGLDMKLRGHRTYYVLNEKTASTWEMCAFYRNKIYRFKPNNMDQIIQGFSQLDGDLIKVGLRSFISNLI
ncbi:MAG: SAVED domain-containing protein [Bacteroidota bacterium]